MDNQLKTIPHPHLLEALFAYKSKVSRTFADVTGIHGIHHIAIARVDARQQILIFSSTPALEFNLFSTDLWCADKTYHREWFSLCTQAPWQRLYERARYDELHYAKQIKYHFLTGISKAISQQGYHYIYSMASTESETIELFTTKTEDIDKIGQYCLNHLKPFFDCTDNQKNRFLII